jgi:allantoinase
MVWDPGSSFIIKEEMLAHRHKISPYLNKELYGVVNQTFLKGEKVYDNGKFVELNKGLLITR